MKSAGAKILLTLSITLQTIGVSRGGPIESAILTAMKLSEKPNYSWTSTIMDDARSYTVEGKTAVDSGWTWVRLPMMESVANRLGREAGPELEAVFKGNTGGSVIRTGRGWQTLAELPGWEPVLNDMPDPGLPLATSAPRMTARGIIDPGDPFASYSVPAPLPVNPESRERPYSNAQFAVSRPHDELAVIVSSYANMNVEGDVITGTLSDTGAQLLLVGDGPEKIMPIVAGGTFKLVTKNGMVVSYLLQLEGILDVGRKNRVHVHQISNTVIKSVGTTSLEVPDDIRRKLGR
jgi:hypothetical protein